MTNAEQYEKEWAEWLKWKEKWRGDGSDGPWRQPPPSPGPWKVYDRGIGYEVHDANGCEVNSEFRETFSKANAELIVRLVNEHFAEEQPAPTP